MGIVWHHAKFKISNFCKIRITLPPQGFCEIWEHKRWNLGQKSRGAFGIFWPVLGINQPTLPYLGKFSQKKRSFFYKHSPTKVCQIMLFSSNHFLHFLLPRFNQLFHTYFSWPIIKQATKVYIGYKDNKTMSRNIFKENYKWFSACVLWSNQSQNQGVAAVK